MKEMVSWRGVAKKRRKQEPAGAINQMFAYCCGHATIVALAATFIWVVSIPPRVARLEGLDFESPSARPVTTSARSSENFSCAIRLAPSRDQLIRRHASPRIAKRNSNHIPAASDRSIRPACDARTEVTPPDINRVRNGSRHFCAAGTFCARFRHAMTQPATRAPTADSSFIQGRTTSCAICRRRF